MRMNKITDAGYWYRESLRAKPDHIPAHLTYGKLLAMTVRTIAFTVTANSKKQGKKLLKHLCLFWSEFFLRIQMLQLQGSVSFFVWLFLPLSPLISSLAMQNRMSYALAW